MEKVIKDGKVGVLLSPGYGGGFLTWGAPIEAIFDPFLIELVEEKYNMEFVPNENGGITQLKTNHEELTQKIVDYVKKTYKDTYTGGVEDLVVIWIPQGSKFIIEENDGFESIQLMDETNWITA